MNVEADHFLALRRFSLLEGVPDATLDAILTEGDYVRCPDGCVIFDVGDQGDDAYFVLSGEIGIGLRDGAGGHVECTRVSNGALLGEIALFTQGRRSARATARGPVAMIRISRATFMWLLKEWPQIALSLLAAMSKRLTEAEARAEARPLPDAVS